MPHRFVDPFGNESSVTYDAHDLLVAETEDALGNATAIVNDFRVLAPSMVTDPNGNRAAFAFDELGLVTKTAVMGKSSANEGDDLDHPTAKFEYDFDIYRTEGTPVFVKTETRETHFHPDEPSPDNAPRRIAYLYSDGLGREVQTKIQAEPGPVPGVTGTVDPRWVGSGWTIYNNKGLPVRKYEPFFSATPDFEFAREEGVSPIVFYDPLGRAVGTLHPDHTYEKIVFDPWKQRTFDRNDTVLTDAIEDADLGAFFSRLDEGAYAPSWHDTFSVGTSAQQDAATKAADHADTPTTTWFDALGRAFLSAAHNGFDGSTPILYYTRTVLDIEGNALSVTDARGVVVMTTAYDVAGRPMRTVSPDAGTRVLFADVHGKSMYTWDSRDQRFRIDYDEVRRPIGTWLKIGAGAEKLVTQTIFGDSDHADAPANPAIFNLRGRVYIARDGSGETTFGAYDFKGNPLSETRQLAVDFKSVLDWSGTVDLESESFTTTNAYDALNRVTSHTTPDASETLPAYNEAGLLESVSVKLRGDASATPFVTNIDYNARGQRTRIEYANGTTTEYAYDAATFRLTNLTTTRTSPAATLQDLTYTYDPVGNITRVSDAATTTVFFDNAPVSGDGDYTYDAPYRLIEAHGREHPGQQQPQAHPADWPLYGVPHPNDTNALINYTETYAYDAAGNITQTAHSATGNAWTQDYEYAANSNRLASTTIGQDTLEYDHDAHGNMALPHLTVQAWDPFDRLQKTSTQSVGSGTPETTYYVYDASGGRVRKVTENFAIEGNTPTRKCEQLYLGGFEIWREYDAGDLDLERESLHVMDPSTSSGRIALVETKTVDEGDPVTTPTPLQRYQLSNHLGSACVEADDSGAVISFEEYYPFGGTSFHSATTSIPKRYRYTGKERDDETGLYYYGARYYAPWLGRWTAADPAGFVDGPNRFAYVKDNPIRFNDPTGNRSDEAIAMKIENPVIQQTPREREFAAGVTGRLAEVGKETLTRAATSSLTISAGVYLAARDTVRTYQAIKEAAPKYGGGVKGAALATNETLNPAASAVAAGFAAKDAARSGDARATGAHAVDVALGVAGTAGWATLGAKVLGPSVSRALGSKAPPSKFDTAESERTTKSPEASETDQKGLGPEQPKINDVKSSGLASKNTVGWQVGEDIWKKTAKGTDPSWSTVRARFWKNEAAAEGAAERYSGYSPDNLERMQKGLAPRRFNLKKGDWESMDLSHEPITARQGGRQIVPRWPQEHAEVDPRRRPGY